MELQEIFNKAHKHFAGMTEPSMASVDGDDQNPQCAYRGNDGNKCIVGAFIPDSLYKGSLEGDSLDPMGEYSNSAAGKQYGDFSFHNTRVTDVLALAFRQKRLTNEQYILLGSLQRVHDRNAEDWNDGFQCNSEVSWYDFIKPEIIACAMKFDLETDEA